MNAETAPELPYNGEMLRWAREWRGRTVEEAAARIGVRPDRVRAWEQSAPDDKPTVRQARELAEFYDRAFLEFFYDEPPRIVESGLVPDFRALPQAVDPHKNRELLAIQHWAEAQRLNAIDLYESLGDAIPAFPDRLKACLGDDVEDVAIATRKQFGFSIDQQRRMTAEERKRLPDLLREKIEQAGVLVLRRNELAEFDVSGLCIVTFPLPIIIFAAEAPGRQVFTMMHEFAHIVLRESAISGPEYSKDARTHALKVEQWCNRFASAFLVPKDALAALRPLPARPARSIDDATLSVVAKSFRVSAHAMLIRLVQLGYVDPDYYWSVKLPEFRRQERLWRSRGRSPYWASRVVKSLGNLYTGLVLEAWGAGKIPFHQAVEYMGLANSSHLLEIRQEFGGA
jgi:Zn-dependent peptidase ImmA (M78 family)/transcriptional regulator with XRE-family HTH domain